MPAGDAMRKGIWGEWRERSACRDVDPSEFFAPHGSGLPDGSELARLLCATCPVQDECLEFALANPDTSGFWAGTNDNGRKKLRRLRRQDAKLRQAAAA